MADVTLAHGALPAGKATKARVSALGHTFGGGAEGDLAYYAAASATDLAWLAAAAGVLQCAGAGQVPAWTRTPTLDGLTIDSATFSFISNSGSSFIGVRSGDAITTGVRNTAYGYDALKSTTIGNYNIAIGDRALRDNVGFSGGEANEGSFNLAIGSYAMAVNTIGFLNIAIGVSALTALISGTHNCGIGHETLKSATTGSDNVAVAGYDGMYSLTTGASNTGVGHSVLYALTTGNNNTAIGRLALWTLTTGSNNVGIGMDAGRFLANGSSANATPGTSVYLGNATKAAAAGNTNQIVIGYNAIGGGSNTATLGNTSIVKTILRGTIVNAGLAVYADNAAALAGGLVAGDWYRTATGELRVTV